MRRTLLAALVFALVAPTAAHAQRMGPPSRTRAVVVSIRGGFDTKFDKPVAGGAAFFPIPNVRWLGLQAAGDLTFLEGLTERQGSVDVLVDLGGLQVGGGPIFRNTIWNDSEDSLPGGGLSRETRTGASLVFVAGGTPFEDSRITVGVEYRLVWVDAFTPRPLVVSVGVLPERIFR